MNNLYSFILGHSPQLSQAEIESVLRYRKIDFQIIVQSDYFLILETKIELDVEGLNNILGGIIKIGKIEFFVDKLDNIENLKNTFIEIIKKNCNLDKPPQLKGECGGKKVKFGFSIYEKNSSVEKFIFQLAMNIKKHFKSEGISSRVLTSKEQDLSAVIVEKEHLIRLGFDMQILNSNGRYYFSRTLAVQDFARFNALDYDRPRVDAQSGMMPPKLAKIMLNLSGNRGIIADPFCGSGTILLMAAELGFKKIIGSDISEKAVIDSQENLKWYQERFDNNVHHYVFKSDVKDLIKEGIEKNSIDCIVSEGYLGKPLRGNESAEFIKKQILELEKLYLDSFRIFAKILKSQGVVVISLPIFHTFQQDFYLKVLDDIQDLGFKIESLLEEADIIVYKRENQKVFRQIVKLVKN
ncbi:methyltransferase domain-containing protein [bacterium]|nr:methyltransferase domain-containing protein [bacterium]